MKTPRKIDELLPPDKFVFCTSDNEVFTDEQTAWNHAILLSDSSVIPMTREELRLTRARMKTATIKQLRKLGDYEDKMAA